MKAKVIWLLLECPNCHSGIRLTVRKRELKELMKSKRETVNIRVEGIK